MHSWSIVEGWKLNQIYHHVLYWTLSWFTEMNPIQCQIRKLYDCYKFHFLHCLHSLSLIHSPALYIIVQMKNNHEFFITSVFQTDSTERKNNNNSHKVNWIWLTLKNDKFSSDSHHTRWDEYMRWILNYTRERCKKKIVSIIRFWYEFFMKISRVKKKKRMKTKWKFILII